MSNWDMVKIEDVVIIVAGQSPLSSTYNKKKKGLPFFQGKADFGYWFPKVRMWCDKPKKIAEKGDILLSVRAPVGPTNICNQTACIGRGLSAIRCGKKIDSKFLIYYLRFIEPKIAAKGSGSTFSAITQSDIKNIEIPLPPLSEQKRIAAILDEADRLRQMDKQLIEQYNRLAQSVFLDMFGDPVTNPMGWEKVKLEDLCEIKSGGTPSRKISNYFSGTIPWVTTVSLGKRKICGQDAIEYITNDAIDNSATKLIPCGSIMVGTRVGVGKASIIDCDMCSSQDIISLINISNNVQKDFLLEIIGYYRGYFDSQKRGATIQGITSKVIKQLDIIMPPIGIQYKFVKQINTIEKQKSIVQVASMKSEALFNSLLQKAFRGEL